MLTYHNDLKLKRGIVAEMKKHQKLDLIIKGDYGHENGVFKGCAVGCAIHSFNVKLGKKYLTNNHSVYEEAIGVPEWLARLHDIIFEGLPEKQNTQFAVDLLQAIPVGVELDKVKWQFCAFIMKENIERVLLFDIDDKLKKQVVKAIQVVLSLHENAVKIGGWDKSTARSTAWSTAYQKYAKELIRLLKKGGAG